MSLELWITYKLLMVEMQSFCICSYQLRTFSLFAVTSYVRCPNGSFAVLICTLPCHRSFRRSKEKVLGRNRETVMLVCSASAVLVIVPVTVILNATYLLCHSPLGAFPMSMLMVCRKHCIYPLFFGTFLCVLL